MNENFKRLSELLELHQFPFYLERNDFERGGISIEEELHDLIREGNITEITAIAMADYKTIWSARFYYYNDADDYKIVYAETLEKVIEKILMRLENYLESII